MSPLYCWVCSYPPPGNASSSASADTDYWCPRCIRFRIGVVPEEKRRAYTTCPAADLTDAGPILHNPPLQWMHTLVSGAWVWLPKEKELAQVGSAYVRPPDRGRIGTILVIRQHGKGTLTVSWYVDANGNGIDGKPVIKPIRWQVPEEAPAQSPPPQSHPGRSIEELRVEVEALRGRLSQIEQWRDDLAAWFGSGR